MGINPYYRMVRFATTYDMRPWRNRQTRTFEGRVGDRAGSSPAGRTPKKTKIHLRLFLYIKV